MDHIFNNRIQQNHFHLLLLFYLFCGTFQMINFTNEMKRNTLCHVYDDDKKEDKKIKLSPN